MTVVNTTRRVTATASAGQTVFNFDFELAAAADLVVLQEGVQLTITADYSVSGVGEEDGGSITLVTGATAGDEIVMYSAEAIQRLADYTTGGDFRAVVLNAEQDKVIRLLQDLQTALARKVGPADSDITGASVVLPAPGAGGYIRWNAGGTALEAVTGDINTSAYLPSGTGAVERTVVSRLGDFVIDADFGAVGDGVADDTTALTNAAATGRQVLLTGTAYNLASDVAGAFFSLRTTKPTFPGSGVVPLGLNFPNSDLNYSQNGATIHRLADRVIVGAAVESDMAFPNVTKDWMATLQSGSYENKALIGNQFSGGTTNGSPTVTYAVGNNEPVAGRYITGVGIPDGTTIVSGGSGTLTLSANATATLTGVTLTSHAETFLAGSPLFYTVVGLNNENSGNAGGGLFGIQTKDFSSSGTSGIGIFGFAVSNNVTLGTPPTVWAGYFEAHADLAAGGTAVGIEIDVKTLHSAAKALPNTPTSVIGLQLGAGAGLSPEGQFDAGAAIQVVANPMRFKTGIRFAADALTGTDGTGGSAGTALALAPFHALEWYTGSGVLVGRLMTTTQSSTQKIEMRFSSSGVQFLGDTGQVLALINHASSAVNYPTLTAAATAVATLGAAGTATDVDVRLSPKGAGFVQFGTHTAIGAETVTGYITIKDAGGTARKLAVVS